MKQRKTWSIALLFASVLLAVSVGVAWALTSTNYDLVSNSLSGGGSGGNVLTSGNYVLSTSFGGTVMTSQSSASYKLCAGFVCGADTSLTKYLLDVGKDGSGSGGVTSSPPGIDCGVDCSETYAVSTVVTLTATVVTLTATADVGSAFTGWSGDCTGTGACQVTMDAAKHVTATFTLIQHALTVDKAGNGSGTVASTPPGIACGGACNADFRYSTVVSLTAVANVGSTFAGWSGDCTGGGACQVTMDAARQVQATFSQSGQPAIQATGQAQAGQPLEFVATLGMSSANVCTWDFDDGSSEACDLSVVARGGETVESITVHATHTFAQPDQYDVTITASNAAGEVHASLPVTIAEAPVSGHNIYMPLVIRPPGGVAAAAESGAEVNEPAAPERMFLPVMIR